MTTTPRTARRRNLWTVFVATLVVAISWLYLPAILALIITAGAVAAAAGLLGSP